MPFNEVIQEFEDWISSHNLWQKELGGPLNSAAFVTWLVYFFSFQSSYMHSKLHMDQIFGCIIWFVKEWRLKIQFFSVLCSGFKKFPGSYFLKTS